MERVEKKVQTIQLNEDDATLMAHMYDLAWLIQGTIFNHYYDEWQLDKDELVDDTDAVMKAIHKLAEHFMSDNDFRELARPEEEAE